MKKITIRPPSQSEEKAKKKCLEMMADDRRQLLVRWPFIGGIIMRMELVPVRDTRLTTAATDGDNIFMDIAFYAKLTKDERLFVLTHEVWHCVLLHFARRQNRNHELFNIAADLEIHFTLAKEHMKEPFVLPHNPKWSTLSAEEIYEKLPQFLQEQVSQQQKKNNETFGDGSKSFDKHIYQGDAIPDSDSLAEDSSDADNAQDKNAGTGGGGGGQSEQNNQGNDEENALVVDKDYAPRVSREAVERSRSRAVASAQQIERTQGKLPSHIQAILNKLQKPSLPWQEMLKQFVTTCYGGKRRWLPPARRHVWQDLYLPSMRDEALKAVVALDTSGSTAGDLPTFFAELVSLMKSFGKFDLDVIQCDAEIQNVEHYSDANVPAPDKKWTVKGYGGTDFCPVFDYIRKNMREQPDLVIFFTDGYGTAPANRPPYPVMWVLTRHGHVPAEWGRIAYLH